MIFASDPVLQRPDFSVPSQPGIDLFMRKSFTSIARSVAAPNFCVRCSTS